METNVFHHIQETTSMHETSIPKDIDAGVADYAGVSGEICLYCLLAIPVVIALALIFVPQG